MVSDSFPLRPGTAQMDCRLSRGPPLLGRYVFQRRSRRQGLRPRATLQSQGALTRHPRRRSLRSYRVLHCPEMGAQTTLLAWCSWSYRRRRDLSLRPLRLSPLRGGSAPGLRGTPITLRGTTPASGPEDRQGPTFGARSLVPSPDWHRHLPPLKNNTGEFVRWLRSKMATAFRPVKTNIYFSTQGHKPYIYIYIDTVYMANDQQSSMGHHKS
jgi:hypothetical protein